ncbi:metal-sensitive transcriptional regulator [Patescibacteria group bacterium]|nr:metal-sensitive transcriptional regulator [Patescibacteria group bacterium]
MDKTLHRLKIAQGHLNKVVKMYEGGEYCIDILLQSQAVQKALKEIDNLVLENHLKTCVADSIKKGKTEEVITEVMRVMDKK